MLVGRTSKETTDRARVVVDFLDWLDPGEGVSAVSTIVMTIDIGSWQQTHPDEPPPEDTTPLVAFSTIMMDANTKVVVLLDGGTPGLVYRGAFLATGATSGRILTVDFSVAVHLAEQPL